MLQNIKLATSPHLKVFVDTLGKDLENPSPGIYLNSQHNFGLMVEEGVFTDKYFSDFGVADSVEQVLEHYKEQIVDPDNFYCISFQEVTKESCPDWRWHKWGDYIGTKTPQCEHLGDEPEIESIVCFSLHKIKKIRERTRSK